MEEKDSISLTTDIRNFIINWNNKFPIDYWWRKKYNIPFGSIDHKNMSMIDMKIDHEESKMIARLQMKKITNQEDVDEGDKLPPLTVEEENELFNNMEQYYTPSK